jgi:hypothetical protein
MGASVAGAAPVTGGDILSGAIALTGPGAIGSAGAGTGPIWSAIANSSSLRQPTNKRNAITVHHLAMMGLFAPERLTLIVGCHNDVELECGNSDYRERC